MYVVTEEDWTSDGGHTMPHTDNVSQPWWRFTVVTALTCKTEGLPVPFPVKDTHLGIMSGCRSIPSPQLGPVQDETNQCVSYSNVSLSEGRRAQDPGKANVSVWVRRQDTNDVPSTRCQAGRILSYLGEGGPFLFYLGLQLIGWGSPAVWRAICLLSLLI